MLMEPGKLIDIAIKGLMADKYEIYPGLAKVLLIMSRLAPNLVFNQMAKLAVTALALDGL